MPTPCQGHEFDSDLFSLFDQPNHDHAIPGMFYKVG